MKQKIKYHYIGITGMPLAGKSLCANYLSENYGYVIIDLGTIVAEEVKKRTGKEPTRDSSICIGKEMRKEEGRGVLAKKASEEWIPLVEMNVNNAMENAPVPHSRLGLKYIFNGIRSMEEVDYFKKKYGKEFALIAILASREIRYQRSLFRKRAGFDDISIESFHEIDRKELDFGLGNTIAVADFFLINEKTKNELYNKLDRALTD